MNNNRQKLIVAVVLGSISLILILILYWLFGHSYIKATVENPVENQLIHLELVNQKTGDKIELDSDKATIKKLVPKGNYEVIASSSDTSNYQIVTTKPFLATKEISSNLVRENKREFVGNNPSPCMFFSNDILFSTSCGGKVVELRAHTAATSEIPTTVENNVSDLENTTLGGIFMYKDKRYALVEGAIDIEDDQQQSHLVEINDSLTALSSVNLGALDSGKTHQVVSYRSGFLIYSSDYSNLSYYSDINAKPENIKIDFPKNDQLKPDSLSVFGDKIAVVYKEGNLEEKTDLDSDEKAAKASFAVQLYENGKTKSYEVRSNYTALVLCGEYLCASQNTGITVLKIDQDETKELFELRGAKDFIFANNKLTVVRENKVIGIDIPSQSGYLEYPLGEYESCGIQKAELNGYILCMIDSQSNKVALHVDPSKEKTDEIDKDVALLMKQPYVEGVSAYKSYIHVTLDLGSTVYNPATKNYEYDPVVRRKVSSQLDKFTQESNLKNYKIINSAR